MNERDTDAAAALLLGHGFERAAGEAEADVVIVNTCSVRGKAEDKALGKLGLLVAGKRDRPRRKVGVIGCMAQRLGADALQAVPGLDFVLGTHRLFRLPDVLREIADGGGPVVDVGEEGEDREALAAHTPGRVAAFVNILYGCDRRCAYCVVPQVRGREWSRPPSAILDEIRRLAAEGVKEVTLLGQSVMNYGRGAPVWRGAAAAPAGWSEPLPRLLAAASRIPGIARLRFTSGHPSGCTAELARAMAELPAVCEHMHLPLQSGSDRMLERMRRGYTTAEYRCAVARLRAALPNLGLTTDVIVGFPAETAEDFERTRAMCEEMAFDNAFIFKYSPRPGTAAAQWQDDVPAGEKMRRNRILLADQDRRGLALNRRRIGRVEEVLIEGPSLRNSARWAGRTRSNKLVVFDPAPGLEAGRLAAVRIERAMAQTLYGAVCGPIP